MSRHGVLSGVDVAGTSQRRQSCGGRSQWEGCCRPRFSDGDVEVLRGLPVEQVREGARPKPSSQAILTWTGQMASSVAGKRLDG